MIELVYVPYEQYRAAKTRCGLDLRIYGILIYHKLVEPEKQKEFLPFPSQILI
jgi:hypothetical protein